MSDNLKKLVELLEDAHNLHAQDQAAGAIDALGAVIHFLKCEGATEAQTLPLVWLGYHFATFKTKEPGNVKPLFIAGREGIAAAAIDALMETGLTEKAASDEVSKATGSAKAGKQLRDWRKNIRQNKTRFEAREQYDKARQAMRTQRETHFAGVSDAFWRKTVLAIVAESYGLKKA
jgi:hypothetical protein